MQEAIHRLVEEDECAFSINYREERIFMRCYIVSYDLKEGGDYAPLIEALKSYTAWAHVTESTWAVVSDDDQKQIRDHLAELIPEGSRLFVVRSGGAGAWRNVICSKAWRSARLSGRLLYGRMPAIFMRIR